MRQLGDLAIKPEMDSGDRGVLDPGRVDIDTQTRRDGAGAFRRQADDIEIRGAHNAVRKFHTGCGINRLYRRAQVDRDSRETSPHVRTVQIRERDGGYAHFV